jgi:hypothetical protein
MKKELGNQFGGPVTMVAHIYENRGYQGTEIENVVTFQFHRGDDGNDRHSIRKIPFHGYIQFRVTPEKIGYGNAYLQRGDLRFEDVTDSMRKTIRSYCEGVISEFQKDPEFYKTLRRELIEDKIQSKTGEIQGLQEQIERLRLEVSELNSTVIE